MSVLARSFGFQCHVGLRCNRLVRSLFDGIAPRHDVLAVLAVRGEHTMEAGEVEPGTRDKGCEACNEVEWVEDDMGGAVAKRLFEVTS